jgi:threonine dehydratase
MDEMLKRALNARVTEVLPEPTPLTPAPGLSQRLGVPVWLKREDLTPVFSFKLRGAYNRIALLGDDELARGIIAASAGNHAQGVAFASRRRGARCRIVMPRTTPDIKIAAVKSYGAEIDLFGDNYSDAAGHARELASTSGMTVVPPFDDLDVIAGQATVGLEILRQAPRELGAILVPVGGGGLISGVAAVIKELRPDVRVIGVQPEDSAAMALSLAKGERVLLDHVGIFADGVAVRQVGEHTLRLCQRYVDEIIQVSQDEICAAIQDAFLETRTLLEPAGALSIAGLERYLARAPGAAPGHAHVAVASGANISLSRLGYIAERAEVGKEREALFAVTIPEQPGSFLAFCAALGRRSVTEFNYRLSSRDEAHVFIGVRVDGADGARQVENTLSAKGYIVSDLSHDELAKTHVRHMVGGLGQGVHDEVLYTFEFPERPGALLQFLTALGGRWNISLFHYRNHGTGFGRVLCGFEVPPAQRPEFAGALEGLGFDHSPVGDSPVTRFLINDRR